MPRLAPSVHTPRFTRGDVLATIDPDTWINSGYRTLFYRRMWAAFAALAACARITPSRATTFTLAQYDTDQLRAATTCGHSYPVLLLPVVVAAIERYLKPCPLSSISNGRALNVDTAKRSSRGERYSSLSTAASRAPRAR